MIDKENIRRRALELISKDGRNVASRLCDEFNVSRQAVSKHLKVLMSDGLIEAEGITKSRVYSLVPISMDYHTYDLKEVNEDIVWRELCRPVLQDLEENVVDIWHYALTEMINNAIEHSEAETLRVSMGRDAISTFAKIQDDGVGIFEKIQKAMGYYDPRDSVLELAKGKLTTDPKNHSGEGIFFTSRSLDTFQISSGKLDYFYSGSQNDLLEKNGRDIRGTDIVMTLANDSERTLKSVFDEYTSEGGFSFDKTLIPVRLAQYEGEKLISRSQAKRLYARFEHFRKVILDFEGVVEIGQAFADELFRVFVNNHPEVELVPVNMASEVERMVKRART